MRRSNTLLVCIVVLGIAASAFADSAEEVQIRFQVFAIAGPVRGDTRLEENIWTHSREDWDRIDDAVTLFDRGYFRFDDRRLELKEGEGLFWGKEKLAFTESQKIDLPADNIRRINAPAVLLEKDKSYTIKIHSQQSFQYFERRPDGLFELKRIDDLPTGLDLTMKPRDKDGRILFDPMRITVRAVGQREPIDGVDLPVGRPAVEEHAYDLGLRVRPNRTYGVLLELEKGQGAVVIFFTTAAITAPALETIKRELGDVAYSVQRKTREGQPAYEVDTWIQGRHIELNIYADGKLRDRSDELAFDELPEPVRNAVRQRFEGRRVQDVYRVTGPRGVVYQLEVQEGDRETDVAFTAEGILQ